jgi:hypothetical protein
MTEEHEHAAQLPICPDRAGFDKFDRQQGRCDIWGEREIAALLCTQPFALHDELARWAPNCPPRSPTSTGSASWPG